MPSYSHILNEARAGSSWAGSFAIRRLVADLAKWSRARVALSAAQAFQISGALSLLGETLKLFGYSGEFSRNIRWSLYLLPLATSSAHIYSPALKPYVKPFDDHLTTALQTAGLGSHILFAIKGRPWFGATGSLFLVDSIRQRQGKSPIPGFAWFRKGLFVAGIGHTLLTKPLHAIPSIAILAVYLWASRKSTAPKPAPAEAPAPAPDRRREWLEGINCVCTVDLAHLNDPRSYTEPAMNAPLEDHILYQLQRRRVEQFEATFTAKILPHLQNTGFAGPWLLDLEHVSQQDVWRHLLKNKLGLLPSDTPTPPEFACGMFATKMLEDGFDLFKGQYTAEIVVETTLQCLRERPSEEREEISRDEAAHVARRLGILKPVRPKRDRETILLILDRLADLLSQPAEQDDDSHLDQAVCFSTYLHDCRFKAKELPFQKGDELLKQKLERLIQFDASSALIAEIISEPLAAFLMHLHEKHGLMSDVVQQLTSEGDPTSTAAEEESQ